MGSLVQFLGEPDPSEVRLATDYLDGGWPDVTIPVAVAATGPTPGATLDYAQPTADINHSIDWSAGGNYGPQGRPGIARAFGWRTGFVSPEQRNRQFDGQRIAGPGPVAGVAVIGQVGQQNTYGSRLAQAQQLAAAQFPSNEDIARGYARALSGGAS